MLTKELHVIIGTGPLGLAVMDELVATGKQVRLINRSGVTNVADGVDVVDVSTTDKEAFLQACTGATVIYMCAMPAYNAKAWKSEFPPLMKAVIDVAEQTGAKVVFGDNLYMYGPEATELTEDLPNRAVGEKGKVRAQVADLLMDAHQAGKLKRHWSSF